jgi:hypothetical protein
MRVAGCGLEKFKSSTKGMALNTSRKTQVVSRKTNVGCGVRVTGCGLEKFKSSTKGMALNTSRKTQVVSRKTIVG